MNLTIVSEGAEGFGVVVSGINLNDQLSSEVVNELQDFVCKYKVVSFLHQKLNLDDIEKVGKLFGTIYTTNISSQAAVDKQHPSVQIAERSPSKKSYHILGGHWHSDHANLVRRPSYTLLYGKNVPNAGGDTEFIDNVQTIKLLPNDIQDSIKTRQAFQQLSTVSIREAILSQGETGFGSNLFYNRNFTEEEIEDILQNELFGIAEQKFQSKYLFPKQNMFIMHPRTKKLCLNVTPSYTAKISGMNECDSKHIISSITSIQISNGPRYSVKWQADMLTIWDNRQVLHRATASPVEEVREMYRVMVTDPLDTPEMYSKANP